METGQLSSSLRERSLEVLEWHTVQTALEERARSPLGHAAAKAHVPFATAGEAARFRTRIIEARWLVAHTPVHTYISGTTDPSELFDRARRDGVLSPEELWLCGHFMNSVGLVGSELRARIQTAPHWAGDFKLAPGTPPLSAKIRSSVSSEGLVLDSASSDLARLRRERSVKRAEFEVHLNRRVKEWTQAGLLQDSFYDMVDGRFVVPVRIEQQSKLDGALVSRSNTGQSVFIEPAELTVQNNALKEIELAIRAEEFRILKNLSREVGALGGTFLIWIHPLAELDLAIAAAVLANDWALTEPQVPPKELHFKDLFHPSLKRQGIDVIKNSFDLDNDVRGLLISGPNTGGKTVLIKAAALAATMARAGLLIPTDPDSKIPHYADVLAFIGDEQSISSGLSSFSAQIMDMRAVLNDKRGPFLIIIDEMLSSTDPEEASALAQALIENFIARGHHLIVTSHFSELALRCKSLAHMSVAAMEFEGGKPTYRLRADELGSSHALEVAARLGLDGDVLKRARELVSTAKLDYQKAQAELKIKERALESEHARKMLEFEREKDIYKRELAQKLDEFVLETESKVEESVEALARRLKTYERQGIGKKLEARMEETSSEALGSIKGAASTLKTELNPRASAKKAALQSSHIPLEVGCAVKVRSMAGSKGTVLEVNGEGRGATAKIQLGNFRLERPVADLEVVGAPKPAPNANALSAASALSSSNSVPPKLDLRGKRYDEAISEAERYIDYAFRNRAAMVTVITGHGTGALKQGLKILLKSLPYVKEARPERQGDDGATLIEFEY